MSSKHFKTFPVSDKKNAELQQRMRELNICEDDLDETFIRGGGKGGQKINKTSSCVNLAHRPSGTVVRCQKERSRELNRFFARRLLCDQLEAGEGGGSACEAAEKIRQRKRRKAKKTALKYGEQNAS